MTLLEATSHLIEIAKTHGPGDKVTERAIRRMEKRLDVLQVRHRRSLLQRRHKAWHSVTRIFRTNLNCGYCRSVFTYGDFVRSADIDGRGYLRRFECPWCRKAIVGYVDPGGYVQPYGHDGEIRTSFEITKGHEHATKDAVIAAQASGS